MQNAKKNSLDPDPGYKLFDTQMVFLKEFFVNVDFEKMISRQQKCEITKDAIRLKVNI